MIYIFSSSMFLSIILSKVFKLIFFRLYLAMSFVLFQSLYKIFYLLTRAKRSSAIHFFVLPFIEFSMCLGIRYLMPKHRNFYLHNVWYQI